MKYQYNNIDNNSNMTKEKSHIHNSPTPPLKLVRTGNPSPAPLLPPTPPPIILDSVTGKNRSLSQLPPSSYKYTYSGLPFFPGLTPVKFCKPPLILHIIYIYEKGQQKNCKGSRWRGSSGDHDCLLGKSINTRAEQQWKGRRCLAKKRFGGPPAPRQHRPWRHCLRR